MIGLTKVSGSRQSHVPITHNQDHMVAGHEIEVGNRRPGHQAAGIRLILRIFFEHATASDRRRTAAADQVDGARARSQRARKDENTEYRARTRRRQ